MKVNYLFALAFPHRIYGKIDIPNFLLLCNIEKVLSKTGIKRCAGTNS